MPPAVEAQSLDCWTTSEAPGKGDRTLKHEKGSDMNSGQKDVSVKRNNLYTDIRKKELGGFEEIKADQCERNLGAPGRESRLGMVQVLGGQSGTQRKLTLTMGPKVISVGEHLKRYCTFPWALAQNRLEGAGVEAVVDGR